MTDMIEAWAVEAHGPVETLKRIAAPLAAPQAGEIVIDVEAMALNPLDLKIIEGRMKDFMPVSMPFVPGSDVVGTVVAVGEGVSRAAPGQRIVASTWNGGLARRALLPASAHSVVVDQAADAVQLAALPMAGLTALNIMRGLGDVAGKRMAVLGATGGVGLALLQQAAAAGASLIASATEQDAELVRANGASEVIDYRRSPFVEELRRRHPDGVDLLVDLVSMFDALLASAAAVRDGGALLSTLFGPDPSAFSEHVRVVYSRLKAERGDLERVVTAHLAGSFRANVGQTFAFEQAREAFLAMRDGHVSGKIVVAMH